MRNASPYLLAAVATALTLVIAAPASAGDRIFDARNSEDSSDAICVGFWRAMMILEDGPRDKADAEKAALITMDKYLGSHDVLKESESTMKKWIDYGTADGLVASMARIACPY